MQSTITSGGGLTSTLDIAALVSALFWPLLLIILWLFRNRLIELAKLLAPRMKSLSLGAVSLEFAEARPLSLQMTGAVDLRRAGQSGDVNDSTLKSFYDQIREPSRLDYAVVDLGTGCEWLTSRLFILSVILARMRGLRALVFVETAGHVRRKFVGVSECEKVRWRLAMRFWWLEAALAHAQAAVWPEPPLPPPPLMPAQPFDPIISNAEGRLEWRDGNPEPVAQLLRNFLNQIQKPDPSPPPPPARTPPDGWESLPSTSPLTIEHAQWLKASDLEQIMATDLDQTSVSLTELHRSDEATKARLLASQTGRWVALTRDDRVFDRLVDRLNIIEPLARQHVTS